MCVTEEAMAAGGLPDAVQRAIKEERGVMKEERGVMKEERGVMKEERVVMKEERGVCVAQETLSAGGGGGLTQLPPPPAVLSPAPSTTMSPPLSEPDHRAEHGGRLKFYGKGAACVGGWRGWGAVLGNSKGVLMGRD